jgi:hypothetical protein
MLLGIGCYNKERKLRHQYPFKGENKANILRKKCLCGRKPA